MSRTILALSTAALLCASSQIAFADESGAITGGVGGAVAGAVVGGPVGAVVEGRPFHCRQNLLRQPPKRAASIFARIA